MLRVNYIKTLIFLSCALKVLQSWKLWLGGKTLSQLYYVFVEGGVHVLYTFMI